jgi:sterol desaturase/sphingolipid hydroxylase (fatty acid hydroxylase superfamily)
MAHHPVVHDREPIRLFKSDFLEFFTHISPVTVLVVWLPVVTYFLVRSVVQAGPLAGVTIPVALAAGLFLWTLAEYLLHRFVFHFPPRNARQERVLFLVHGVHHAQPRSKTRLVMPPVVSIPLAALFYLLYWLVVAQLLGAPQALAPLFAGFALGYVFYDMTHYSLHHIKLPQGYLHMVRNNHMRHHGQTPNLRFGVTTLLWDKVFHTAPRDE